MTKETRENGAVFFRIILTLLTGKYEYKYCVDGEWQYDVTAPTT